MNGRRVAGPLLAGLLLGVLPVAGAGGDAVAGGVGDGALRLSVTVNGRAGAPAVRVGGAVVKRYRLVNRGEAHLYGVRVLDPSAGAPVVCPTRTLAALAAVECLSRFTARAGRSTGTATATGDVPSLRRRLTATARSGYVGVGGALTLAATVRTIPPRSLPSAVVGYTVTNRGNRPVHGVRLTDRALRPARIDCAGRAGVVPVLPPGRSVRCTASVRRPPGVHRSTGEATGSDRVTTVGTGGGRVAPPLLVARAAARFTLTGAAATSAAMSSARPRPRPVPRQEPVPVPVPVPVPRPVPTPTLRPRPAASAAVPGPTSVSRAPVASATVSGAAVPSAGAGADAGVPAAPLLVAPAPAPAAGPLAAPGAADAAGAATGAAAGAAGAGAAAGAAGAVPPAAVPPRAAPPAAVPPASRLQAQPQPQVQPPARTAAAANDDEGGLLGRIRRRSSEIADMGVALTLLLILIPGAVAAALLGSRRP
ncbi:hypothetical protein ACGFMM_10055 [Streptomyces sp. NPDC048604]|uniref:hypothetical protein n=1 Tax=Streptomyces sp. NPDC048604 TaxID=3365578 RepID=UPI00371F3B1D